VGLEPPPGLEANIENPVVVTPLLNSKGKKPLYNSGKIERAKPKEIVPQVLRDSEIAYVPLPPDAMKDVKVGMQSNPPGLFIKAAAPFATVPDGASTKVVLSGLPKQLSSNEMFQAIVQQSGFEKHILKFDLCERYGIATIYFRDFCMANMCINHFEAASWMPKCAAIRAFPVTGAKLRAAALVDASHMHTLVDALHVDASAAALPTGAPAFIPLRQDGSVEGRGLREQQQQRLNGVHSDASTEVSSIAEAGDFSELDDEEENTQNGSTA
jgi:hypothetical protein